MKKRVLIFPAGMSKSLAYLERCKNDGHEVIGASSLGYDSARKLFLSWVTLPFITDSSFDQALKEVIELKRVDEIYTPNSVVWRYLRNNLKRISSKVLLEPGSAPFDELSTYKRSLKKAHLLLTEPLDFLRHVETQELPTQTQLAGLWRYADLIPGMSYCQKMHSDDLRLLEDRLCCQA